MPDSRKLDAAMAEALFGWTQEDMRYAYEDHFVYRWRDAEGHERSNVLPEWSTTGDGMLLVIKAMRARGYWLHQRQYQNGYMVCFHQPDKRGDWRWVDTSVYLDERMWDLPGAVALAALRALGVSVEGGDAAHG